MGRLNTGIPTPFLAQRTRVWGSIGKLLQEVGVEGLLGLVAGQRYGNIPISKDDFNR